MLQAIADSLSLGSVYVLFALGLSLSWSVLNLLNLAYGAQFMLGAYFAYLVGTHWHHSLLLVLPVVVVIVAATSVLADNLVFRHLRRQAGTPVESELSMLVASIGLAAVAVTLVQHATAGESEFVPQTVFKVRTLHFGGLFRMTNMQLIMLIVTVVLTVVLAVVVKWSRFGRAMRGVAVDPATCELLGVNSNRLFSTTIAISGAMAGLAGVLLAIHLSTVDANMGDPLLTKAFAIIIIGGVGSIAGAAVGGYLLAFAETFTVVYGPANYKDAIAFIIILIVLLVRPTGLFARKRWERS
ncbi:MAG TPA: branched-chain amino acid ABC transporter permease [Acidothermaceae bacterium]|jgi:branched-chain amino acid transport system permease protein|nr:branched-chain amino acid ABC transporter permease [Acidothermaceae bacterium]